MACRLLERCLVRWAGSGAHTVVAEVVAELPPHYQLLQEALDARLRAPISAWRAAAGSRLSCSSCPMFHACVVDSSASRALESLLSPHHCWTAH
jgi:hypothetical protein